MAHLDKAISGTVVWADLATPDLDKARTFYGELLGWTFDAGDDAQTGFYTTGMRNGRRAAAMWKKPAEMPGPSAFCLYFGTDSVDESLAKVAANGGSVIQGAMDVMEYGRMAVCSDPGGAVFGLWQSKSHTGAQIVNEPGAMCWYEVLTRAAAKVVPFYARVFGLEANKMEGAGFEYWTLHKGPDTVGGIMQMGEQHPKEMPPHWNLYFAVSNADAAVTTVQKLGGKVLAPPFDTPYGRMSPVQDPLGAHFSIIQLPQG